MYFVSAGNFLRIFQLLQHTVMVQFVATSFKFIFKLTRYHELTFSEIPLTLHNFYFLLLIFNTNSFEMAEIVPAAVRPEPLSPETILSDGDKDPRVRYFNLQHSQFILMFFFMLIAWNLGYWGFSSIWVILVFLFLFTGDIYTRQLALRRKLDALLVKDELRAVEEVVETLPSWVCIFIDYTLSILLNTLSSNS